MAIKASTKPKAVALASMANKVAPGCIFMVEDRVQGLYQAIEPIFCGLPFYGSML